MRSFLLAVIVSDVALLFASMLNCQCCVRGPGARVVAAREQVRNFCLALNAYKSDAGHFPSMEEGLQALRMEPTGATGWRGPYLTQDIPLDPWSNRYEYRFRDGDAVPVIVAGTAGPLRCR
ncbi:MAG: type II secretion system protein GspG [Bryobacteraceae bacterium]